MKADKTAKSFPTYRILVFSKFDSLDPTYQTSKKREFDRLEKIWHCLSAFILPIEEKAFVFAHFTRQNIFFSKKNAQNQRAKLINFFENESNFFHIILDSFNKFLKTWSWTSW